MSNRFVAVLFTNAPASVTAAETVEALASEFPMMKPEDLSEKSKAPDNGFVVGVGGAAMTVRMLDEPLEMEKLKNALATSIGWREARDHVAAHQGHIVIAPLIENTPEKAATLAAITSATASAIAAQTETVGVYWASADLLIETGAFRKAAAGAVQGTAPLPTWVKFMPVKGPDSDGVVTTGFITAGFSSFVGREVEVEPAPLSRSEIGARMVGFMNYLLAKGPVVQDGDTIGVSDNERIRVAMRNQNRFTGRPVYHLTIEAMEGENVAGEPARQPSAAAPAPEPPRAPSPAQPAPPPPPPPRYEAEAEPVPPPEPAAVAHPEPDPEPEKSSGLMGRLFGRKK